MTPDVNVLVAASRSDHPHHRIARTWLEQVLVDAQRGTTLTLQPMATSSFLRLVTHPRIFKERTPISAALEFVDAMLDAPGVAQPEVGREWKKLRDLYISKMSQRQ